MVFDVTDMNINAFWSFLCPMMTQIEDLKRETEDLRLKLSQLQQEVNILNREKADSECASVAHASQFQAAVTNIGKAGVPEDPTIQTRRIQLPDDLLRIIFMNCLPNRGEAAMKAHEAPVVFGRVCSRWRRVAWSTQELWDNLQISIPAVDRYTLEQQESKYNAYVAAIGSWLDRSGGRPLCVSVVDENSIEWNEGTEERMDLIGRIMEKLLAETSRLKSIKLELPEESIWSHLLTSSSQLPVLEVLKIRDSSRKLVRFGFEARRPFFSRTQSHGIITTPCLRSLHLGDVTTADFGLPGQPQPGFFKLPWGNLRDLSIGELNPSGQVQVLITTLNAHALLKHLAITGTQLRTFQVALHSSGSYGDLAQIDLPSLEELIVADEGDGEISQFFYSLNCSSLLSFKFQSPEIESYPFLHLLRMAPGLETLCLFIKSYSTYRRGLSECLKLCPQIKELQVSARLSDELDKIDDVHLPHLETLVLDCTPAMDKTSIFQTYLRGRSDQAEAALRIGIERARRASLRQRIALIKKLCNASTSRDTDGELRMKEVSFRLNNRLYEHALHGLAPLIAMGLRVTFMADQYDIPPPVESPSWLSEELWRDPDDTV